MKKGGKPRDPNYWKIYAPKRRERALKCLRHCDWCNTDKPALYVHKDKKTGEFVCRSCRKQKRNPEKVRKSQRAYINQNGNNPVARRKHRQIWTTEDLDRLVDPNRPPDHILQLELGRTLNSIPQARYKQKKKLEELKQKK